MSKAHNVSLKEEYFFSTPCGVCKNICSVERCVCTCKKQYHPHCILTLHGKYVCPDKNYIERPVIREIYGKHKLTHSQVCLLEEFTCMICSHLIDDIVAKCECGGVYHPQCIVRQECSRLKYTCPLYKSLFARFKISFRRKLYRLIN